MNLPNKITILRLVLVIPFISLLYFFYVAGSLKNNLHIWAFYLALAIFIFAMITDFIDGYLARKQNSVTTFGKIADPIADKIITSSAMIFLSILEIIPLWVTIIFILRDIIIDGVRNFYAAKGLSIHASFWGKLKTVIQSLAIILAWSTIHYVTYNANHLSNSTIIILKNILFIPLGIAAILALWSGFEYLKPLPRYLKFK